MKTKKILLGILINAAFAAGMISLVHAAPPIAVITSREFEVRGEVTSRTPIELTIVTPESKVAKIQVTDATTITKAGLNLKLSDIKVGDTVTATVMRDGEDKLSAVRVTVRVGNE